MLLGLSNTRRFAAPFLICASFMLGGGPSVCYGGDSGDLPAPGEIDRIVAARLQEHVQRSMAELSPSALRGYQNLTQKVYLPADFDAAVMERLEEEAPDPPGQLPESMTHWPRAWRAYGLSPRPDRPELPLQYVVTEQGNYVMNCFACHGGQTYGTSFPGAPNTGYALQSLTAQVRRIKLRQARPLAHMDIGSVFMPLGTTIGTSNAVMFGVALMNFRDAELNVLPRPPALMTHHDMDPPPWWHFHRKHHLYIDGFAEKGHRGLMQFMLVRQNGPDRFRAWEDDFRDVFAFLSEVRPPKYPLPIDHAVAQRGQAIFQRHCATCHGTYGPDSQYPERSIDIEEIGTDPTRWEALSAEHRQRYGESWFADFGGQDTIAAPLGYTAPPLDGIWASAPYLHHGSLPTLAHLLELEPRPVVWRRAGTRFDEERVGFQVESLDAIPPGLTAYERAWIFDTQQPGKSAAGHDFAAGLSIEERRAVLEYLKTL